MTLAPHWKQYVSATKVSSPHLNRLRRKKERYFKNGQKHRLNHINEQISSEIKRISSLITRRLFIFSNPKDTWNALKQLTGEHFSYNVNDETSLDDLNASFINDRSAPELEPLSLPMSTAPEGFISKVNVTKAFQSLKLKSS